MKDEEVFDLVAGGHGLDRAWSEGELLVGAAAHLFADDDASQQALLRNAVCRLTDDVNNPLPYLRTPSWGKSGSRSSISADDILGFHRQRSASSLGASSTVGASMSAGGGAASRCAFSSQRGYGGLNGWLAAEKVASLTAGESRSGRGSAHGWMLSERMSEPSVPAGSIGMRGETRGERRAGGSSKAADSFMPREDPNSESDETEETVFNGGPGADTKPVAANTFPRVQTNTPQSQPFDHRTFGGTMAYARSPRVELPGGSGRNEADRFDGRVPMPRMRVPASSSSELLPTSAQLLPSAFTSTGSTTVDALTRDLVRASSTGSDPAGANARPAATPFPLACSDGLGDAGSSLPVSDASGDRSDPLGDMPLDERIMRLRASAAAPPRSAALVGLAHEAAVAAAAASAASAMSGRRSASRPNSGAHVAAAAAAAAASRLIHAEAEASGAGRGSVRSSSINRRAWSIEEDQTIRACVAQMGMRWRLIAPLLPGR